VLPQLERLPVPIERPAVRHPEVRAADHSHEPPAQMALHPLVAIAYQVPERCVVRRSIREYAHCPLADVPFTVTRPRHVDVHATDGLAGRPSVSPTTFGGLFRMCASGGQRESTLAEFSQRRLRAVMALAADAVYYDASRWIARVRPL
jgi:hypothetical protein